jgi:hypothetical protein
MLLYLLASYGLAWFLVNSPIADPVIDWLSNVDFFNELFSCIVCTSFWCGVVLAYFFFEMTVPFAAIPYGLAALGFTALISEITGDN